MKPIVGIARSLSDQVCTLRISTATPVNGLVRGSYQTVTPHSYQETAIEMLYINQSINQSMALSASCAGHTRTQSHAALYKINNEVVHSGMVASDYKRGSE